MLFNIKSQTERNGMEIKEIGGKERGDRAGGEKGWSEEMRLQEGQKERGGGEMGEEKGGDGGRRGAGREEGRRGKGRGVAGSKGEPTREGHSRPRPGLGAVPTTPRIKTTHDHQPPQHQLFPLP